MLSGSSTLATLVVTYNTPICHKSGIPQFFWVRGTTSIGRNVKQLPSSTSALVRDPSSGVHHCDWGSSFFLLLLFKVLSLTGSSTHSVCKKKTIFDQVLCKNMDGGYLVYLEQLVEVSFGDFVWRYSGGISPIRAGKGSRLALPPHLSTPVHHHYGNAASQVPLFHPYLPSFFSQLHRNAFILHRPYLYVIPWSMDISIFILTSAGHVVAKSSELQQGSVMISF